MRLWNEGIRRTDWVFVGRLWRLRRSAVDGPRFGFAVRKRAPRSRRGLRWHAHRQSRELLLAHDGPVSRRLPLLSGLRARDIFLSTRESRKPVHHEVNAGNAVVDLVPARFVRNERRWMLCGGSGHTEFREVRLHVRAGWILHHQMSDYLATAAAPASKLPAHERYGMLHLARIGDLRYLALQGGPFRCSPPHCIDRLIRVKFPWSGGFWLMGPVPLLKGMHTFFGAGPKNGMASSSWKLLHTWY